MTSPWLDGSDTEDAHLRRAEVGVLFIAETPSVPKRFSEKPPSAQALKPIVSASYEVQDREHHQDQDDDANDSEPSDGSNHESSRLRNRLPGEALTQSRQDPARRQT